MTAYDRYKSRIVAIKEWIFFIVILCFVLIVNRSIVSFDIMYAEQPLMYVANQALHTLNDLFAVYLHPHMFDIFYIPFFRPSGHFLMYQLLAPLLGWHNTKGFIMVNLLFLAMTGYGMVKLYELLFPGQRVGGYIAFSVYLMHPALMLSRLIILHFEFAYVFFVVTGLYCFVRFVQKSPLSPFLQRGETSILSPLQKGGQGGFLLSLFLFLYAVAITFKEPAVMLGPVAAAYFGIFLYKQQHDFSLKEIAQILLLITVTSMSLALYLTLSWPTFSASHPLGYLITRKEHIAAAKELIILALGLSEQWRSANALYSAHLYLREIVFPLATKVILWAMFLGVTGVSFLMLLKSHSREMFFYKKSFIFLFIAALLFLILPISYGMGLPWHLSLTLVCLSMMMGFSCELWLQRLIKNNNMIIMFGIIIALVVGMTTVTVNNVNIKHLVAHEGFNLLLGRNAVMHPPDIKSKLDVNSVLVVEEGDLHNSYALGSSAYPYVALGNIDFDALQRLESMSHLKYQPIYNGNSFRYAYLMPTLQEEIYPFKIEYMERVPNEILYNWLEHADNIFCVGFDKNAHWSDKTTAFKASILHEQVKRMLKVYQYEPLAATLISGDVMYTKVLAFPDYQLCQYECSQNNQCKSFTYEEAKLNNHSSIKCQFYDSVTLKNKKFCASCISFIREKELS